MSEEKMDEAQLVDALAMIVETLDQIVSELDANLGPQAIDTIKEPLAKTHKLVADLRETP